jgi:putative transport protein
MIEAVDGILRGNSIALLFVVLAAGALIGRINVRGFELGPVTGVLFSGLVFGHFGYELSASSQAFGFVMFIFSVGYQAGPSFFEVLRQEGAKYFVLAMVVATTGFGLAVFLGGLFDFPLGTSAGLLAGAMTTTPTLAAAQDALQSADFVLPEGMAAADAVRNVTTAYAITYLFGLIGLIIIIRTLPGLLGIDLVAEAQKIGGGDAISVPSERISLRAYRVEQTELLGMSYSEILAHFPPGAAMVKQRRNGEFLEIDDQSTIELGDEIAIVGTLERFLVAPSRLGPEIQDAELLEMETESAQIVVTQKDAVGLSLGELSITERYGCFLTAVSRVQVNLPLEPSTELKRGDVLSVTGPSANLDRLGERLGHLERPIEETDLLTLALGIGLGIALGTLTVKVAGISVGLGTAGGLLTTGLVIGYLRSLRPTFGRIPPAARWVFMELGLQVFMAGVGVSAGSGIIDTLVSVGPKLVLCGIAVTVVPVITGWLVGSLLLRLNPAVLLGAITGSMTSGAALSIVNSAARSSVPSLGYTGAYAFANVILTVAGTLIVRL